MRYSRSTCLPTSTGGAPLVSVPPESTMLASPDLLVKGSDASGSGPSGQAVVLVTRGRQGRRGIDTNTVAVAAAVVAVSCLSRSTRAGGDVLHRSVPGATAWHCRVEWWRSPQSSSSSSSSRDRQSMDGSKQLRCMGLGTLAPLILSAHLSSGVGYHFPYQVGGSRCPAGTCTGAGALRNHGVFNARPITSFSAED